MLLSTMFPASTASQTTSGGISGGTDATRQNLEPLTVVDFPPRAFPTEHLAPCSV